MMGLGFKQVDRDVLRRGVLLGLVLLAFAVRLGGLTAQSFWRDEVDALRYAQAPFATLLGNFGRPGWNGPLFYVILRYWIAVVGRSEFAVRFLPLWFGVLGVALTYRLGRAWCSARVGALGALLVACSPYMVWYAQEAKMYAPICALVLGALYLYRRALESGSLRLWVGVVVLTWVAAATHVMGALLTLVMGALLWVWWPTARQRWRGAALGLGVCALPGLSALPWVAPLLVRGGNIGHRFVPLPAMLATMVRAFSEGIVSVGSVWPTAFSLFGLLAGTVLWPETDLLAWVRRRGRALPGARSCVLACWAWLLVPIVGLYAITLRVPMFLARYLIWIGPAFYLLVARGLDRVRQRSAIVSGLCLAAIVALNGWGVWEQTATPIKSDFRAAAAYVRQHRAPDELILFHISYVRETFEYYYGDAAPADGGLATDQDTSPATVDAEMRSRVAGYDAVWLVLSEPEMWDRRGLTVAWLDAHAQVEMRADFARVSVIKYRFVDPGP